MTARAKGRSALVKVDILICSVIETQRTIKR
jgi:hypothetical protein